MVAFERCDCVAFQGAIMASLLFPFAHKKVHKANERHDAGYLIWKRGKKSSQFQRRSKKKRIISTGHMSIVVVAVDMFVAFVQTQSDALFDSFYSYDVHTHRNWVSATLISDTFQRKTAVNGFDQFRMALNVNRRHKKMENIFLDGDGEWPSSKQPSTTNTERTTKNTPKKKSEKQKHVRWRNEFRASRSV